jgi:hypothetical protein
MGIFWRRFFSMASKEEQDVHQETTARFPASLSVPKGFAEVESFAGGRAQHDDMAAALFHLKA